jgi:hypothetical protein
MGILYFIQPSELVGTDRYKIGCSKKDSLDRVKKGYRKGTRYISINEVNDPFLIEKTIKEEFKKKFTLISGTEYFKGNETEMINIFLKIMTDHKLNTTLIEENPTDESENEIDAHFDSWDNVNKGEFTNYREDISFGGDKKLIKINIKALQSKEKGIFIPVIRYLIEVITIHGSSNYDTSYDFGEEGVNYFNSIISENVIESGKIYDLLSLIFIKKLDRYKKKIKVHTEDSLFLGENAPNIYHDNINNYIASDSIMISQDGNKLYCDNHSDNIINKNKKCFYVDSKKIYKIIYKINNKWIDYDYIRKYLPYVINTSREYPISNRDYEYIENLSCGDHKGVGECNIYLFNDGCKPWENKTNFNKYLNKYIDASEKHNIININKHTCFLLSLYKVKNRLLI